MIARAIALLAMPDFEVLFDMMQLYLAYALDNAPTLTHSQAEMQQ